MKDMNIEMIGPPLGLKKGNSEQSWESTMDKRANMFQDKKMSKKESRMWENLHSKIDIPLPVRDSGVFLNNRELERLPLLQKNFSFNRLNSIGNLNQTNEL